MSRILKIALLLLVASVRFGYALPVDVDWESEWEATEKQKQKERQREEREEGLYDAASSALDEKNWREAVRGFDRVIRMSGSRSDAAMYWKAYSENKLNMRAEALETLAKLQREHPDSKWLKDGKALELEVRQSSGQSVSPERVTDEELKLIALNSLIHSDPERALPILDKVLKGPASPKMKDKALFVLSQSGSPKAATILGEYARGSGNTDLQRQAVKYLGLHGGEKNRQLLADIYIATTDLSVKRSILNSLMLSGDRGRLLSVAKTEKRGELRGEAVRQLGLLGARTELAELYRTETQREVRKDIIQAMFLGGDTARLAELARSEKDAGLRAEAIRSLGLIGGSKTGDLLVSLYGSETTREIKSAIIEALFLQGNSRSLIALAKKERDGVLKRDLIEKISLTNSKEANDFLADLIAN